jgi:hypothetical protein
MDFAQLRSSVFDAEEESVQSTPIRDQLRNPSVGFPLLLGICSLGLWGVDKFVQDNQLLTSEGEYDYRPMVFSVMGLFPLGFGLGGLLRGLEANEESEKYEEILETAEAEMERLESELVEAEDTQAAEEAQQKFGAESNGGLNTFFLSPSASPNTNTTGIYGSAMGQQPVSVRSSFQRDTFGF